MDPLTILRISSELSRNKKQQIFHAFLDNKKAFGIVSRQILLNKLLKINIP